MTHQSKRAINQELNSLREEHNAGGFRTVVEREKAEKAGWRIRQDASKSRLYDNEFYDPPEPESGEDLVEAVASLPAYTSAFMTED